MAQIGVRQYVKKYNHKAVGECEDERLISEVAPSSSLPVGLIIPESLGEWQLDFIDPIYC